MVIILHRFYRMHYILRRSLTRDRLRMISIVHQSPQNRCRMTFLFFLVRATFFLQNWKLVVYGINGIEWATYINAFVLPRQTTWYTNHIIQASWEQVWLLISVTGNHQNNTKVGSHMKFLRILNLGTKLALSTWNQYLGTLILVSNQNGTWNMSNGSFFMKFLIFKNRSIII